MLYNIKLHKEQSCTDCLKCDCFNHITKKCNGINKVCFEYDKKTMTIIDPITKLPLKLNEEE